MGTVARTSRILVTKWAQSPLPSSPRSAPVRPLPSLERNRPGARGSPQAPTGPETRTSPQRATVGTTSPTTTSTSTTSLPRRRPTPAARAHPGPAHGVATIDLVALQDLDRFNLDLRGMTVRRSRSTARRRRVSPRPLPAPQVDGAALWQVQDDADRIWELTIQPRPKLKAGQTARVVVDVRRHRRRGPTDIEGALYGWVTTRDGAMVVERARRAATWYPVNDHPTDKATYSFAITVPQGKTAVANGVPAGDPRRRRRPDDWCWDAPTRWPATSPRRPSATST